MAEDGVLSAGEHRSHPTLQAADFASSNDENPTMKGAEAAGPEPMGEPALGHTQVQELPPRDDAVLAPQ
jgi:hypothetical protein